MTIQLRLFSLCTQWGEDQAMAATGAVRWSILLIGSVTTASTTSLGFSVGRASEGQFEYDALNGRMTPRYTFDSI